ncbi:unnamed protein product [Brachionus calyciflorus]|uniref:Uncharacterized protein n=1 Tax=Brachionus calyciflorus TaxID=104777 RepID=A0A813VES5_9BILA|nr:unnamed protein product [Brachionus calyciflorus]
MNELNERFCNTAIQSQNSQIDELMEEYSKINKARLNMMMLGQYPDQSHSYVNALTNETQNRHSRTAPYPTPSKRNINVPNMNSYNQYPYQYYPHQQQQPLLFTNTPIYPNQFNNQFHSYYSSNQQENSHSVSMNNQLTNTQQASNHINHLDSLSFFY